MIDVTFNKDYASIFDISSLIVTHSNVKKYLFFSKLLKMLA